MTFGRPLNIADSLEGTVIEAELAAADLSTSTSVTAEADQDSLPDTTCFLTATV